MPKPKRITNRTIYELGVLTIAFILLDQTVTDLWVDLNELTPELEVRADFMHQKFTVKIERLKKRISELFGEDPPTAAMVKTLCSILD